MTRISGDPYVAEILHDPGATPLIWHWLVQRRGEPEILYWGQEKTEDDAVRGAQDTLDYLLKRARRSDSPFEHTAVLAPAR